MSHDVSTLWSWSRSLHHPTVPNWAKKAELQHMCSVNRVGQSVQSILTHTHTVSGAAPSLCSARDVMVWAPRASSAKTDCVPKTIQCLTALRAQRLEEQMSRRRRASVLWMSEVGGCLWRCSVLKILLFGAHLLVFSMSKKLLFNFFF